MSAVAPVPNSTGKKVFAGVFYALFCAVTLTIGTAAGWVNKSDVFKQIIIGMIDPRKAEPKSIFNSESITLLVLGCDETRANNRQVTNSQARSDMILLTKLDFVNNRISGISIPRDLWVELPGDNDPEGHKINAYHAIGGKPFAQKAVEYVTGVKVDRTLVLDFEAFQDMVDVVGGVEVFIEKPMEYHDNWGGLHIDLQPGRQKLDGYEAMGYVRFRKSDSDFARMDRQKEFMLAFKSAILSNPAQIPVVLEKAAETLGGGLKTEEITALSHFMRRVPNDSIRMTTLSVRDGSGTNLLLNKDESEDILKKIGLLSGSESRETGAEGQ